MSLLARLHIFIEQSFFVALHVDNEFDQLVELLNGTSTDKRIYTQYSDGALPVLRLNQTGAGPILELQLSGSNKLSIANSGQIISTLATGTAPITVASTTLVSNLNAQYLQGYDTTGFLRNDTSGQALKGGIRINKLSGGTVDLEFLLDSNTLTCQRQSDGEDIWTLSLLSAATRLLSFPSGTQVQSAFTPTADNDVARKVDVSESNVLSQSFFFGGAPTTTPTDGWICPRTGMKLTEIKASYRTGTPTGSTALICVKNDVTTLGTVTLLIGTAVNTPLTTNIDPDETLSEDDHLTFKLSGSANGHQDVTCTAVFDNT